MTGDGLWNPEELNKKQIVYEELSREQKRDLLFELAGFVGAPLFEHIKGDGDDGSLLTAKVEVHKLLSILPAVLVDLILDYAVSGQHYMHLGREVRGDDYVYEGTFSHDYFTLSCSNGTYIDGIYSIRFFRCRPLNFRAEHGFHPYRDFYCWFHCEALDVHQIESWAEGRNFIRSTEEYPILDLKERDDQIFQHRNFNTLRLQ